MSVKIKMYYKSNGTKVSSHTRGLNRRKNSSRAIVGSNNGTIKALLFFGMLIVISGIFSWQATFNEMDSQKVKAKDNTCPVEYSPLTKEQGFESKDMPRDTVTRDGRSGDLFDKYFKDDSRIMRAICTAESGLKPESENKTLNKDGSWDIGYCQINVSAHWDKIPGTTKSEKVAWLKIPENNVGLSKRIFDDSGFYPWSDYKNGNYLKHLK